MSYVKFCDSQFEWGQCGTIARSGHDKCNACLIDTIEDQLATMKKDLAWATIHLIQELPLKSDRRTEAKELRKKWDLEG